MIRVPEAQRSNLFNDVRCIAMFAVAIVGAVVVVHVVVVWWKVSVHCEFQQGCTLQSQHKIEIPLGERSVHAAVVRPRLEWWWW
jgi:hypothetical protein